MHSKGAEVVSLSPCRSHRAQEPEAWAPGSYWDTEGEFGEKQTAVMGRGKGGGRGKCGQELQNEEGWKRKGKRQRELGIHAVACNSSNCNGTELGINGQRLMA